MEPLDVLVVCTGNLCRSPMAEVLLRDRLAAIGVPARVRSAGVSQAGRPAPKEALAAVAAYGLDLEQHRSRRLDAQLIAEADLVLAMAREHGREVVLLDPAAHAKTFTLKELVRRAGTAPRRDREPFAGWLERCAADRKLSDLLGASDDDDVADPYGRPAERYQACAAELVGLVDALVAAVWRRAA